MMPKPDPIAYKVTATCEWCGGSLRLKQRKKDGGDFIGCSKFPACEFAAPAEPTIQRLATEIIRQREEITQLKREVDRASRSSRVTVTMSNSANVEAVDALFKELIFRMHPDRATNGKLDASDLTSFLLKKRAEFKKETRRG